MIQAKNIYLRLLIGFVWFFFLPNTIYLLTDITHLFEDILVISGIYLLIDILFYVVLMVLGVVTFIWAMDPFERLLLKTRSKKKLIEHKYIIYGLNFLVGFGLVLGRVHRVNSWEVITDTSKVIHFTLETFKSIELMFWVVGFTILSQVVYMKFRKFVPKISY